MMEKKTRKMDRYLIAAEQDYELDYIAQKFGITRAKVREALTATESRSRRVVYKWIRNNILQNETPLINE